MNELRPPNDFTSLIDLAGERFGGAALLASDEFFAAKENLIRAAAPVWREGEYTERGKWMDGWESRRRRTPGHDWCIVRLGRAGMVRGVVVDTSHFTGNYPESCSIDACVLDSLRETELATGDIGWIEILPRVQLRGDALNPFAVDHDGRFTHLRLNIYPDGGVARLRVHGVVVPDWPRLLRTGGELDLAAAEHGGRVVACSDMHYGDPQKLIMPGQPVGMHDGWETRRRRGAGHDWVTVRLGTIGTIRRIVIDTSYFRGNAPGSGSIDVCSAPDVLTPPPGTAWRPLLMETPLSPHAVHDFVDELVTTGTATHARLNIFPDGGVARLRLFGVTAPHA